MGFFSNLFKKSGFFSSEYTDKSMMPLTDVMNAHANWKSRVTRFASGSLGYSLDPEVLSASDDTELGRWILQMDAQELSGAKRKLVDELHKANVILHQVASTIASKVQAGKHEELHVLNDKFTAASKQVMVKLIAVGQAQ